MTRDTIFPGILVESIRVRAGGSGVTAEFEEGLPEQIPTGRIQDIIDQVPVFGSDYADSSIEYTLLVDAPTEMLARVKTRAFIRSKNPFEAHVVEIEGADEIREGPLRGTYRVMGKVDK